MRTTSVNALTRRVRSDGHVNFWERVLVRAAEARHNALACRPRHN